MSFQPSIDDAVEVPFGVSTWETDDIEKLLERQEESVAIVDGIYFQSFGYFHQFKQRIRKIFAPSTEIKRLIDDYDKTVFKGDRSHKLCIHLRDFEKGRFKKSNVTWTFEAAKFIIQHLKTQHNIENISVVVFSDNKNYSQTIAEQLVNEGSISKAYAPTGMNRGTEMVLGQTKCQSMILTTIGSTFGWWMAYFMEEEAQKRVFYSEHFFEPGQYHRNVIKDMEKNYIRPEWKRIRSENGTFHLDFKEKEDFLFYDRNRLIFG
uniref:L-Fucosyltransferase n=1 Tax=Bursaphelenchus xylophilus TaxID=6326 RepID=A0A1I7SA15_BURXY